MFSIQVCFDTRAPVFHLIYELVEFDGAPLRVL